MLRVRVAFACKRVALLSTACERICLDVLTHTFVFYYTSTTYLYSKYILFAGINLHGLQTSIQAQLLKSDDSIETTT